MAKLYPPNIEGTIPAFTGTTLVVPFSMNSAVAASEVKAIIVKVKKVNTNDILLTKETSEFQISTDCWAEFEISAEEWEPVIGQYYRIQIAYKNDSGVGYFSSIGVVKYTSVPSIVLLDMKTDAANLHKYAYTAVYSQVKDSTEKLYSTQFKLVDSKDQVIYDSGEVVHSVLNDVLPTQAIEKFEINQDLKLNETHRVLLKATTINGLTITAPKYRVVQRENVNLMFEDIQYISRINARSNFDEGCVDITLKFKVGEADDRLSGTFVIARSEVGAVHNWKKLKKFFMRAESINKFKYTDYTVEQGKTYVYSLQQYNNYDIYSSRIISNEVYADFEDMFLLDGERQLKIRFNPKVSSMKNNIIESKVNTIGSRYPFITRNGHVNHKEFSLSGLISYQMDDNRNFMSWEELGLEANTINLTSDNIQAEREFKLAVLEWLNDGKPKIFKSPVEGNYIVRLMGISLSPIDTVGRMLHSFNCTASEIAPFDYDALNNYKFIDTSNVDNSIYKWRTISLAEYDKTTRQIIYKQGELLNSGEVAHSIRITDMVPGSIFYLNNEKFIIGATGSYYATATSPITSIKIPEEHKIQGSIEISYKDTYFTQFDKIRKIELKETPALQIIGSIKAVNLIEILKDVKTDILNIPRIRFNKRGVHKIYVEYTGKDITMKNEFYYDGTNLKNPIDLTDLNPMELYEIYYSPVGCTITDDEGTIKYQKGSSDKFLPNSGYVLDLHNYPKDVLQLTEDNLSFYEVLVNYHKNDITGEEFGKFSVEETEEYIAKDMEYSSVVIGNGVIAEFMLSQQVIEYSYELEHPDVKGLRAEYDRLLEEYRQFITDIGSEIQKGDSAQIKQFERDVKDKLQKVKNAYTTLVVALERALMEDYMIGG